MGTLLSLSTSSSSPDTPAPGRMGPSPRRAPLPAALPRPAAAPAQWTPALSGRVSTRPAAGLGALPGPHGDGTWWENCLLAPRSSSQRPHGAQRGRLISPFSHEMSPKSLPCPRGSGSQSPRKGTWLAPCRVGDMGATQGPIKGGGHAKRHQSWQDSGWGVWAWPARCHPHRQVSRGAEPGGPGRQRRSRSKSPPGGVIIWALKLLFLLSPPGEISFISYIIPSPRTSKSTRPRCPLLPAHSLANLGGGPVQGWWVPAGDGSHPPRSLLPGTENSGATSPLWAAATVCPGPPPASPPGIWEGPGTGGGRGGQLHAEWGAAAPLACPWVGPCDARPMVGLSNAGAGWAPL